MPEKIDKETRSFIMRQVKSSKNKSTEEKLAAIMRELGVIGWRRNSKKFGKPDFIFPRLKIALFVDGCFWHGHFCKSLPITNRDYWVKKIERNKQRDKLVNKTLKYNQWKVIRIWECDFQQRNKLIKKLTRNLLK